MIRLADVFQDNMVFQRHKPIKIFGTAQENQSLSVYIDNEPIIKTEIQQGEFTIILPEQETKENITLTIASSTGENIIFNNVDIGEVWLAGGQSNMEFLMKYEESFDSELTLCEDEHLRFYNVPQYSFEGEEKEGFKENSGHNKWHSAVPDSLWCFSAAGYFHAKKLRAELGVPVAILGCNWGGTSASAWMDIETLENDDELRVYCDDYRENENKAPDYALKEYRNRWISYRKFSRWANDMILYGHGGRADVKLSCMFINAFRPKDIGMGWQSFQRPGGLYETMLKKIVGYTVRGVIWYQGESDEHHVELYSKLFTTMINRWRDYWKDNLPFIFVQLAPFEYGQKYAELRRQQEIVEQTVDKTYMVTISDIGNRTDIHPKNKHDIGYRLALKAMKYVYKTDVVADSPYAVCGEADGNDINLHFSNCKKLIIKGEKLNAVRIFCEDGRVKIKSCTVKDNTLILRTENARVKNNIRVEFAWTPYYEVNLYNEAGLPAKPFILVIR